MYTIRPTLPARRHAGFSMLEAMIAVGVMGVLVAVGVPRMKNWVLSSQAYAAADFYAEGFRLARQQAISHNAVSRITLDPNAKTGQMDWQVDLCFPTVTVPCSDTTGVWSTRTTVAGGDPEGVNGFKSVFRGADALPDTSLMAQTFVPLGTTDIYYTSLGWVNTNYAQRLQRMTIAPSAAKAGKYPNSTLVISLAGMVSKCDPNAPAHDSRACPP